jgi:hypothetical protein
MNMYHRPPAGLASPLDVMLASVAIRIQLSRTDYRIAVERVEALNEFLDRPGSPLRGRITLMYLQGSMAIGSTVARGDEDDEFDVDVIVQLDISRGADPTAVLDLLYEALRGEVGSRYNSMVTRHTRCVTVHYKSPRMHIDLTPAVLVPELMARTSVIFHSKPEDPNEPDQRLLANPFGLAQDFIERTPKEADFAAAFRQMSLDYDLRRPTARAPSDPVPDQIPAYEKSMALISHQLAKRWRNRLYARFPNYRRPPSVFMAKQTADYAGWTRSLADEVVHQALQLRKFVKTADDREVLVYDWNPRCRADILTDRWPRSHSEQRFFIEALGTYASAIDGLRSGEPSMAEIERVLGILYGEKPAKSVVDDYVAEQSQKAHHGLVRMAPATGVILSTPAVARSSLIVPHHTNFGGRR